MSFISFRGLVFLSVALAVFGCSSKKPQSPANTVSNAGAIPIPCPAGQTSDTFTDAQGHQITLNCTPGTTTTATTAANTASTGPVHTSSN